MNGMMDGAWIIINTKELSVHAQEKDEIMVMTTVSPSMFFCVTSKLFVVQSVN
jgi:hypothetical protein